VQLAQITTTAGQSSVDFTSISGSYTSLKVVYSARDNAAGGSYANLSCKVNNDATSGDYSAADRIYQLDGSGATDVLASTSAGAWVGLLTQSSAFAGYGEITFANYTTNVVKSIMAFFFNFTSGNGKFAGHAFSFWDDNSHNTPVSAISRLTFTTTNAFEAGGVFTLYGLK
jgi:hypothetical protein